MSLSTDFKKTIIKKLQKDLGLDNIHQVPKLDKVIVACGVGSLHTRKGVKDFTEIENNLKAITGQKAILINARMSVSNFKLRE